MRSRVMAGLCAHPERIPVDALSIAVVASRKEGWHVMARSMLRACLDVGGWRPALSLREVMRRLETPTLFAWGDCDAFAPPSSGQELAGQMRAAKFDVLEDAGHLPQLDQPEALAAAITRFLA
jgi:pimeloyl-ACP methyl ester carboxylesterase